MQIPLKPIAFLLFFILALSSCKVKYLEYELKLEKARNKDVLMRNENKDLKKEISLLNDSLSTIVQQYEIIQPYSKQIAEIAELKKNFLECRVPYYVQLKKKDAATKKSQKK